MKDRIIIAGNHYVINKLNTNLQTGKSELELINKFNQNMLKLILNMLDQANGETENIRIAQGKNKLPITLKDGVKTLKTQSKWLLKKQGQNFK